MAKVYRLTDRGRKKEFVTPEDGMTLSQLEYYEILDYLNTYGAATVEQITGFTRLAVSDVLPIIQDFVRSGLVENQAEI
jgi:hypothetical protein